MNDEREMWTNAILENETKGLKQNCQGGELYLHGTVLQTSFWSKSNWSQDRTHSTEYPTKGLPGAVVDFTSQQLLYPSRGLSNLKTPPFRAVVSTAIQWKPATNKQDEYWPLGQDVKITWKPRVYQELEYAGIPCSPGPIWCNDNHQGADLAKMPFV